MMFRFFLFFGFLFFAPTTVFARVGNDTAALQKAYELVGVSSAWDITTGKKEVIVAIIDNGFDANHPDLKGNVWKNRGEVEGNGKDDDKNGFVDDVYGWDFAGGDNDPNPDVPAVLAEKDQPSVIHHATVVAGIIGATGNNGIDGAGINWNVELMNIRAVNNTGVGDLEALALGIRYAVQNGAHIINISMIGSGDVESLRSALELASRRGVAVIAAAGNNSKFLNQLPEYPICLDQGSATQTILGVSAIEPSKHLALFSNYGSDCIDITAPGTGIESTVLYLPEQNLSTRYRGSWNGTSFSTPFVTGAAALVKSLQPTWRAPEIYTALQSTAARGPGKDNALYADFFGAGLLQVQKAVEYAKNFSITNKPSVESLPQKILAVSRAGLRTSLYDPTTTKQKISVRSMLSEVNQVVAVTNGGNIAYAALQTASSTSQVLLLDKNFQLIKEVVIPVSIKMNLLVAPLDQETEPRIILSPVNGSNTEVVVYSLAGKKIFEKRLPKKHTGTFVAVRRDLFGGQNQLMVVVKGAKNSLSLRVFSGKGALLEEVSIALGAKPTGFALLEAGQNAEQKLIFAHEEKTTTQLSVFDMTGVLSQAFTVPKRLRGGVALLAFDVNGDGVSEIVVAPQKGVGAVSLIDQTGKTLQSWYPFGTNFVHGVFLMGN